MENTIHAIATPHDRADFTNLIKSPDETFFADETNPADEPRALALEVITRFLIWIVEGTNAPSRETRATVALYCVRPDLIGHPTLEQLGNTTGISQATACKLARDFRLSMGL